MMSAETSSVRVLPAASALHDALRRLDVRPGQEAFVSPVATTLADALSCHGSEAMAIMCDSTPIGFYRLEHSARTIVDQDYDVPAMGVRSFLIDAAYQGRGLGKAAMRAAIADVQARYGQTALLVLTVNCRNPAALALYLACGFEDSGQLYAGGRSGPQHVLLRRMHG